MSISPVELPTNLTLHIDDDKKEKWQSHGAHATFNLFELDSFGNKHGTMVVTGYGRDPTIARLELAQQLRAAKEHYAQCVKLIEVAEKIVQRDALFDKALEHKCVTTVTYENWVSDELTRWRAKPNSEVQSESEQKGNT